MKVVTMAIRPVPKIGSLSLFVLDEQIMSLECSHENVSGGKFKFYLGDVSVSILFDCISTLAPPHDHHYSQLHQGW